VFLSGERDGEVREGDGRELFPLVWMFKGVKDRMRTPSPILRGKEETLCPPSLL